MFTLRSLLPALLLAAAVPVAAQNAPSHPAEPGHPAAAAHATEVAAPATAATPVSAADEAVIAAQKPSYPLKTCVVSDEALGGSMGEPIPYVFNGRYMEFCCAECRFNVEKEPAKFLAKLDAAVIAAQKPGYPLTTCVMSGEKLGDKAVDFVYGTRLVEFCGKDCEAEFLKNPAPALAKIDEALIAAQSAHYPLATCPVSGEKLEDPVEVLYGVQLVKFCCKDCAGEFRGNPGKYLPAVQAAVAAQKAGTPPAAAPAGATHADHEKPKGG